MGLSRQIYTLVEYCFYSATSFYCFHELLKLRSNKKHTSTLVSLHQRQEYSCMEHFGVHFVWFEYFVHPIPIDWKILLLCSSGVHEQSDSATIIASMIMLWSSEATYAYSQVTSNLSARLLWRVDSNCKNRKVWRSRYIFLASCVTGWSKSTRLNWHAWYRQ
jgi:hypothetical protein